MSGLEMAVYVTYVILGSVEMQTSDGNLVIYDALGSPYWSTGTNGHPLVMALQVKPNGLGGVDYLCAMAFCA